MDRFLDIWQEYWSAYLFWDGFEVSGLAVTLWILVLSLLFGFVLSVLLAIGRTSKNRLIKGPIWLFTYVFRGTPFYIQLLLIYSGLMSLEVVQGTPLLRHFFINGYYCVILALTLNTTAYTTEMFAGYIRTTNKGEIEAALAYGMSKWQIYTRIIIPSMLRRAIPAYSNEVILMLHTTSLAFAATVPDILKVARDAYAATYQAFIAYGIAALVYMVVAFVIVAVFRKVEKRALAYLVVSSKNDKQVVKNV
ncbi:Histidine transport system permease protein hisM [Oligella ureolytica]|uniref:Histidine/lysine/arginine/ornithine transport system permease protein HisM n=1 Tax=Oligella ureolytica TaxID=90244 RepID=A0A378XGK0_9BURK|nr:histidine ABC transporter permease HisM [Oligella ureolytica]NLP32828.1 histidine ABC transporter permease HisM [Oligella ureolytica]QPT39081.1 histidine ABC transporter permease HisM [Oligella ureolytica]SUA54734.1 Histidine transport system permease protein hisM [Oligella ureolytica]